jgi:hypothetical protein
MTKWRIKYRGGDDITEETISADEFIDNVVEVRTATDPLASAVG